MKRILSFFMVFVLLFNFVLPRRSEAVAPAVGVLLSNPKTYIAVGSLLASAGIVYENADSLKAGVNDFLNKSAQIREHVYNAMLISGIYFVNGIQKNIFPVSQDLYNSAVEYVNDYNGNVSSVLVEYQYLENEELVNGSHNLIPYNVSIPIGVGGCKKGSVMFTGKENGLAILDTLDYHSALNEVTSDIGVIPFMRITPSSNDWFSYNNSDTNAIPINILGYPFKIRANKTGNNLIIFDSYTRSVGGSHLSATFSPVYISGQPVYASDENGVWFKGLRLFVTSLKNISGSDYSWGTSFNNTLILQCNTPDGVSTDSTYNHPDISALFTTFNESTGLYEPKGGVAPQVQYSTYTPTLEEWDYNADEQVGIVLPSGSIDNYVGTTESVTVGELTTYTGEKTGELDWTNTPSIDEGEEGGGSISGEFDIGKWLTGTGAGTLSGTLDNAFSNVNSKIDSLTNSISNVFNPELSWENSNFRWFDFIILFLDVILACIRLTIRFLVFVVTLTQIVATPLISNSHMLQGIDFLKNITIPETNFTIWGLLTSFATAMIGVSAFKFIKRKFRF